MNFGTRHDTAENGRTVNTTVELLLDDAEPFSPLPWRVVSRVDSVPLATSYHATRDAADEHAEKMHAAYLEVHSHTETERWLEEGERIEARSTLAAAEAVAREYGAIDLADEIYALGCSLGSEVRS